MSILISLTVQRIWLQEKFQMHYSFEIKTKMKNLR